MYCISIICQTRPCEPSWIVQELTSFFLGDVGQIADVVIAICSCQFLLQIAECLLIWFALSVRLPGHLVRATFILVKRNEPSDYRGLG